MRIQVICESVTPQNLSEINRRVLKGLSDLYSLISQMEQIEKPIESTDYNPRMVINKEGTEKSVWLHQKYQINESHNLWKSIDQLMDQLCKKQSRKEKKCHLYDICLYSFYPHFEFLLMKIDPKSQRCCICQFQFEPVADLKQDLTHDGDEDIICLGHCEHLFHKHCIASFVGDKKWLKCPVCSVIYGIMIGDQPEGTMNVYTDEYMNCDGYDCGTIVVSYNFPGGVRNGRNYPGTQREGYLPNNEEGRKVCQLFKTAFQRKLMFTIGRSVTTGADHVIVWNGIHHKTCPEGGSSNFGYPDPTYLIRVREELAKKGIY